MSVSRGTNRDQRTMTFDTGTFRSRDGLIRRPSTFRYDPEVAYNVRVPMRMEPLNDHSDSWVRVGAEVTKGGNWCPHCLAVLGTWHKVSCSFVVEREAE